MTELQHRMTKEDFDRLRVYWSKRGPLNPMLRADSGFALVAAMVLNASKARKPNGQLFTQEDFMPWSKEDEPEATLEGVFALFKGLAKRDKT